MIECKRDSGMKKRHISTVATRQVYGQPLWGIVVVATFMEMLKPDKFLKITKTGKDPCVLKNHQTVKTNTPHLVLTVPTLLRFPDMYIHT